MIVAGTDNDLSVPDSQTVGPASRGRMNLIGNLAGIAVGC